MAVLFPKELPDWVRNDRKRRAECTVFDTLADNLSKNFHIYYSCWWFDPDHRQNDGEADFIIAHKDLGIIFIEVKGGQIRRDDQGNWFSHNYSIKNPISQARKSKHVVLTALRKRYEKVHGVDLPYIYVGHFAFLPDTSKPSDSYFGMEMRPEQFAWLNDLQNISKTINKFFDYRPNATISHPEHDKLGAKGIKVLNELINKEFDWSNKMAKQIELNNYEIRELTEDQHRFEKQHSEVKKLWCEGPAGSGKTSLALRKYSRSYEDRIPKALFLCRNKMLQENILNHFNRKIISKKKNEDLVYSIKTFKQLLYDLTGMKSILNDKELLSLALDSAIRDQVNYDVVIIDESQDFETDWWIIIESIIHKDSILWIFGDSNQRIWKTKKPEIDGIEYPVKFLEVIRNTKQIADFGMNFYEGKKEDIRIKGPLGSQIEVNILNSENEILKTISRMITIEGLKPSQIAVIHQKSSNKSNARKLAINAPSKKFNFGFTEIYEDWIEKILISSIYKFKGLESDVVILYIDDIDNLSDEEIYVGITRARSNLVIFCEDAEKMMINKRLEISLN